MAKNIYFTFDTEGTAKQLMYNIGYVIHDRKGNIFTQGEYVISDIYDSEEILTAYYVDKLPLYTKRIAKGLSVISFKQAINEIKQVIKKYKVNKMSAYNANYDMNALYKTAVYTDNNDTQAENARDYMEKNFPTIEIVDVYPFAVTSLLSTRKYCKWICEKILNGLPVSYFFTPVGNLKTGAESVYKYLIDDPFFVEEHTALADALIETQILTACYKTCKTINTAINVGAWKLVQNPFKEILAGILQGKTLSATEKISLISRLPKKVTEE